MKKNILWILSILISPFILYFALEHFKLQKIHQYEQKQYKIKINSTTEYLRTLISEKQNSTLSILLTLVESGAFKNALKNSSADAIDLAHISQELRRNTNFKNVWFHIISKEGISLKRSWTHYRGDNVIDTREDLQEIFKNPQILNTISVGKFDMTFKSIIPIFDNGEFLGVVEAITHFNSIAKKLALENVEAIILADKKYKNQISKPFTKEFLGDYYVANIDANRELLEHLAKKGVDYYMQEALSQNIAYIKEMKRLMSYYKIEDSHAKTIGHILLFYKVDTFSIDIINEIKSLYNIYFLISLFILFVMFGIFYKAREESVDKSYKIKVIASLALLYVIVALSLYFVFLFNTQLQVKDYKHRIKQKVIDEFSLVLNQNKLFAKHIFDKHINNEKVVNLFKSSKRQELYALLEADYQSWQEEFNVRQVHFHTYDMRSFLRMHKKEKFGDSLVEIRPSVVYVHQTHKSYEGFEEGRIYNGFRFIYPLFDKGEFIGSVEVSFNLFSVVDNFMNTFNKTMNFLVRKEIVEEKVFEDEKFHYIKSPIKGFYFDKEVLEKLKLNKKSIQERVNKKQDSLENIAQNILKGEPFVNYFQALNEVSVIIPIKNKITKEVVASINITQSDDFIEKQYEEFYFYTTLSLAALFFAMLFLYKEFISKYKSMQLQKETNRELERAIQNALAENTKQLQILQQQSKMASMGEMIGSISHQWRQPLNELGINIQNLKYSYLENAIDEKFIKNFIEKNKAIILFMSHTIDEFRNFFRIDKHKELFSIQETIKNTLSMQSAQLKNYDIEVLLEGEDFYINNYKNEFQQVILNIINNARDALLENSIVNPKIFIKIYRKSVTISDNAGGIDEKIIERIFEPYFTTKEQGKGTGIGLYMSKIIIEQNMKGHLSVQNIPNGAEFIIRFNML